MIVSVPFAFQVRSLQGLVKLDTELARRTACRAQVKQLKSEKLSPCSRRNLTIQTLALVQRCLDHCQPARSYFFSYFFLPKTGTVLILLPEINHFLQNRQWGSRSISLSFQTEQNTAHFPLIFPGVTQARKLIDRERSCWQMIGRTITRWRNSDLKYLSTGSPPPPPPTFPSLSKLFFPKQRAFDRGASARRVCL